MGKTEMLDKKLLDIFAPLASKITTAFPEGKMPLIGNINVFVIVQTNDDIDVSTEVDVDLKANTGAK